MKAEVFCGLFEAQKPREAPRQLRSYNMGEVLINSGVSVYSVRQLFHTSMHMQ
jgi:hypothetical protein